MEPLAQDNVRQISFPVALREEHTLGFFNIERLRHSKLNTTINLKLSHLQSLSVNEPWRFCLQINVVKVHLF